MLSFNLTQKPIEIVANTLVQMISAFPVNDTMIRTLQMAPARRTCKSNYHNKRPIPMPFPISSPMAYGLVNLAKSPALGGIRACR